MKFIRTFKNIINIWSFEVNAFLKWDSKQGMIEKSCKVNSFHPCVDELSLRQSATFWMIGLFKMNMFYKMYL